MTVEETREETWKRTVADMQGEIHALQMTVVRLQKQIAKLEDENKTMLIDQIMDTSHADI